MRSATILDVLHAVTRVARVHEEVEAWWYAPPQRLRVAGGGAETGNTPATEVAIDAPDGVEVDHERLARELRDLLNAPDLRVRRHLGADEPRVLFRLVTTRRGG